MIRTLSRSAALVSLLLLLATIVLWVRGQSTVDHFWLIHGDDGSELIRSAQGSLSLRHTRPNARSRITFPRRVSHWSCRVGSQLPPKPSPLHWDWRFINYEGTPAATPFEVRSAYIRIADAARVRVEMGVTEAEWEGAQQAFRRVNALSHTDPDAPIDREANGRLHDIVTAQYSIDRGHELLKAMSYWEWSVPAWVVATATAVPPSLWAIGLRRRRRIRREGRCPGCGYDLRASRERCPECGLAAAGVVTGANVLIGPDVLIGAAPTPAPADVSRPRTA